MFSGPFMAAVCDTCHRKKLFEVRPVMGGIDQFKLIDDMTSRGWILPDGTSGKTYCCQYCAEAAKEGW